MSRINREIIINREALKDQIARERETLLPDSWWIEEESVRIYREAHAEECRGLACTECMQ